MPFRDNARHFEDILQAIDHVENFLAEIDLKAYRSDFKTKSAVERQMQVITEAAVRLGEQAAVIAPGPDWKGWRAMGNLLRHAYHRIEDELIWNAAKDDLPLLKEAVLKALKRPDAANSLPESAR